MRFRTLLIAVAGVLVMRSSNAAIPLEWGDPHQVIREDHAYRTTGGDPWLISQTISPAAPPEYGFLLLEMTASASMHTEVRWWPTGGGAGNDLMATVEFPEGEHVVRVVNLATRSAGVAGLRLDPGAAAGVTFTIHRAALIREEEIPMDQRPLLVDFRCMTSKLHYLPGELIEYRTTFNASAYPDRKSAKILEVRLLDEAGEVVATDSQHFGIPPNYNVRESYGILEPSPALRPGRYRLSVTLRDLRADFRVESEHVFGVLGEDDPFVCETPFKFVKDFSILQDTDGLWHVFSITGEFYASHAWEADGQERTFSHSTSPDLRHWTRHAPVLSITDRTHPDGVGTYEDRNIWAPHVIRHGDLYYMFYTSVNQHVSQSISLATSKDLFTWEERPENPVFTLEGVKWADWNRDSWADCRDPMVLIDRQGDGPERFLLYVTAHAASGDPRGLVVVAESEDLVHWRNPRIAIRGPHAIESPQVWKEGNTYCMATSAAGNNTWTSNDPVEGWKQSGFPRPPIQDVERYTQPLGSYAEEILRTANGDLIMAGLTFRHWGNSIYIFKVETDPVTAEPIGYITPFGF